MLEAERNRLRTENEKLQIANESHIDTIQSLTKNSKNKSRKFLNCKKHLKVYFPIGRKRY